MPDDAWKSSEDDYRRESDRKWRERVDDRLASLTTGEQVQNDRLDDLDEEIEAIKGILDGDPHDKDDSGVVGDLKSLTTRVNSIWALMGKDSLGDGGIIATVKDLKARADQERINQEYRWKFWLALVGLISAVVVALVTNLDKIQAFLNKKSNDPIDQMIDKAKNPKGRHIRIRKVVPQEDEE